MTNGQKLDIILDLIESGLMTAAEAYDMFTYGEFYSLSMETVEMDLP